jgi:hypothetical protein
VVRSGSSSWADSVDWSAAAIVSSESGFRSGSGTEAWIATERHLLSFAHWPPPSGRVSSTYAGDDQPLVVIEARELDLALRRPRSRS